MVSFIDTEKGSHQGSNGTEINEVHDLFLTQEQALTLRDQLSEELARLES